MKARNNYPLILVFVLIIGLYSYKTNIQGGQFMPLKWKEIQVLSTLKDPGMGLLKKDQRIKEQIAAQEKAFNESFYQRQEFIENYGLIQRLFGSNFVDDADPKRRVYQGKSGALYYSISQKMDFSQKVQSFQTFKDYAQKSGIGFSVIIPPNKINGANKDFPPCLRDYTLENTESFHEKLKRQGIEVLNLDQKFALEHRDKEAIEAFYLTDTHWKSPTIFWAYQETYKALKDNGLDMANPQSLDLENYTQENYPNTYLGSMGKRVGKKYPKKKDDMVFYFPKKGGDFTYKKIDENGQLALEKRGSFKECFFYPKELASKDPYQEKYTSLMSWGMFYEEIQNHTLEKGPTVLIIRDSFALPLGAYLSQNVSRLIMVENRLGKNPNQLYEIIDKEKPDQIVFMGTTMSAYYYPEMFELGR